MDKIDTLKLALLAFGQISFLAILGAKFSLKISLKQVELTWLRRLPR